MMIIYDNDEIAHSQRGNYVFKHTHNPEGRGVSLERRSELSGVGALLKGT